MPLLSVIRRGREQAKERKEKDEAKTKGDTPKVPYRHVPTHAAIDAMSGAPNTIKEYDRAKILEQHRRRSFINASGVGKKNMPRLGSSLSVVSYPSPQATPAIARARSSRSMPIHPRVRAGASATYGSYSRNMKGKEREARSLPDGGHPHIDTEENSSVSDDDLEMKNLTRPSINRPHPSAEVRSNATKTKSTGSENPRYLYPGQQRHVRGERSNRNLPHKTARTRFAEPKPIDLMFSEDLERDYSSTTLKSAQNEESYASSSTSEAAPASTTPTSLASTPDPPTATPKATISYFPPDVGVHYEMSTSEPAAELRIAEPSSDTSVDISKVVPSESRNELETLSQFTPCVEKRSSADTTTLEDYNNVGQTHIHPSGVTSIALVKPSKKSRWSWRRSKLTMGDGLITSH